MKISESTGQQLEKLKGEEQAIKVVLHGALNYCIGRGTEVRKKIRAIFDEIAAEMGTTIGELKKEGKDIKVNTVELTAEIVETVKKEPAA